MEEEWEIIGPEEEDDEWDIEDTYDPNLAEIRSSFQPELEDPTVRELLAASTKAEVGDQPLHVQKAYMETVLNRAKARNSTIADTVTDPNYYPSITHGRMSGMMGNFQDEEMQQLDTMVDEVVKGSNISLYATGNESGNVHSGGAPVSYNPGTSERFVQENADKEWVNKTATDSQEDWEIIPPGKKEGKLTEAQPEEEWEIIPPQAGEGKKPFFATEEEEKLNEGRGPNYPAEPKSEEQVANEPAFQSKQSPTELVDSVQLGIDAGKEAWAATNKAISGVPEAFGRGLKSAGLGLGETINRYAYSPIVHGLREAIDYVAPGSDLATAAKNIDDAFYRNTVEIPAAQRAQLGKESAEAGMASEMAHAVGTMAGDLPVILATGGALPELKTGMQLVNTLRHGAASMTVPAMRAGTDAAAQVKAKGGDEWEQLGAFAKTTAGMMAIGSLPLSTSSGAKTMAGRFAERAVKSAPLASAAVESGRMLDNLSADIFGGEKHPFSLKENIKATVPMMLVGGVAGRDTSPSKFERTFGFSPLKLDKVDWMRQRMDAEGLSKATPERVAEWEEQWKKGQGEEAPVEPEAPAPKAAEPEAAATEMPGGPLEVGKAAEPGPVSVKRSAQALGIVSDPKATKGFEMAREEAKNIADYLNKAEHWGPWNSAVGHMVAGDQKIHDNVMRQAEELRKLAPDEQGRKGATMFREAGGNMGKITGWGANVKDAEAKAAYRAAGALKPNELELVAKASKRFKELNMWLNANGIDVAELENYVTHMYHTGGIDPQTGKPMRSLSSFFKYSKPRHYDSYFAAIQAGEKPKTLDLVDILSAYEVQAQRAINKKKFVDRLKFGKARDGDPILGPDEIEFRQKGYQLVDAPGLEHRLVHPDHANDLRKMLGESQIQKWLNERTKNPLLNIGKGVLQVGLEGQKYAKGTMFSLSLFHHVTEGTHALGHRVSPFSLNTKEINLNDPKQYDAAVHGLMLRPDRMSMEQFAVGVGGAGKSNYNLVTKFGRKFGGEAGRKMADMIDGYTNYLFESYIPRLKMDTYEHILERNTDRFSKDLASGKVSMSEVKSLSADQANAAYGHLNYTKMARSATARDFWQIALLAPDFFEARARFAGQAAKGLTGSKVGAEQLVALSLLGIGQYVAARTLNYLDHGDAEWDPEHAFQVKTDLGGLLPDKRWVGLRSVPEDIVKAGVVSLGKGDINKAAEEAFRFSRHRLSPGFGLAVDNLSRHNWKGEKTDFGKSIMDLLSNVVPMPAQGFVNNITRPDEAQSISPFETMLKSLGIQIHRVSPLSETHELANEWLKKNDRAEYDRRQASTFPQSDYKALRFALEDSDKEGARAAWKKLNEDKGKEPKNFQQSILRPYTGSYANDQRFYNSLNKHDKAIFNAAIKRRALILERYQKWVGPLGTKTDVTETGLHRKMQEAKEEELKETLQTGRTRRKRPTRKTRSTR